MSTLERLVYIHYIVGPCSMACILLDAILCFKNNFWKKPLPYMVMLATGMSIYTAARTTFFFTIIVLSFSFLCRYSMNRNVEHTSKKKAKKKIWIIIIIVVFLMAVMTVFRGNSSQNPLIYIVRTIVAYFCAGVRVLDQTLQNPSSYGLTEFSFGLCTFSGLIGIIAFFDTYILGAVGFNLLPYGFSATTIAQGYLYNNIQYGTTSSMNAFPTMLYYFLRDGGVFFLIVAVFIFMRVLRSVEFRFKRSQTVKNQFVYGMLFYAAIMSACWWEPMRTEFWTIFIWGLVICKFLQKREKIIES